MSLRGTDTKGTIPNVLPAIVVTSLVTPGVMHSVLGTEWVTPDITEDVVVFDILKEVLYDLQHCIQYLEDLLMAIHN